MSEKHDGLSKTSCTECHAMLEHGICSGCHAALKAWVNDRDVCHHPVAHAKMQTLLNMLADARTRIKADAFRFKKLRVSLAFPAALVAIKEQEKLKSAAIRSDLDNQYPGE